MELRVLRYFLMVAREENITRAAGLLHVTQPTLSRQLIQLEEELGVKLFHRNKYRITLTEEGLLLKQRAQEIVALSDKAKQELTKSEGTLSGEIAIGCAEARSFFRAGRADRGLSEALPARALPDFTARRPTTSRTAWKTACSTWGC